MTVTRHKGILAALFVAAAAVALSPLLSAQSTTSQPANLQTKSPQQRRLDAAAKAIDYIQKKSSGRIEDPELWHTWQLRWLESAKALAPDAKARQLVLTEFRDRMNDFAAQAEKGRFYFPPSDLATAEYYLAESEVLLEQETRK